MKRYDMSYDPDFREDCIVEMDNGEYALYSEAQTEIERLKKEVERWKNTVTEMLNAVENDPKHIRDTAHNDAIEEAARLVSDYEVLYDLILALRR